MAIVQSSPLLPEHVVDARRDLVNVFFHLMDGKTLCLLIDPLNDDIISLKKRVLAKSGTPFTVHDLFMVWNGKPFGDNGGVRSLREGATVTVSYRNRGGCFMVSFSILVMIGAALLGSFCTCGLSLCVVPFLVPLLFILPLFCL